MVKDQRSTCDEASSRKEECGQPGFKETEEAKKDGGWHRAYNPPSKAKLPEDFVAALKKNRRAETFFKTLNKSNVYATIFRLENARSEERRKEKIRQFVKMFEKAEKFH